MRGDSACDSDRPECVFGQARLRVAFSGGGPRQSLSGTPDVVLRGRPTALSLVPGPADPGAGPRGLMNPPHKSSTLEMSFRITVLMVITLSLAHGCEHTHTHTHTHIEIHTHTHTHAYAHTHTHI